MIASPNYSSRGGHTVRLVAIHTAEGALTATALGNYFAQASSQVSSHVGIDDGQTIQYVDYAYATWTMLTANPISDQAELCGFAAWSRDTWLTQHRGMLDLAAAWIRSRCLARGIPIVKLSPAQVGAGQAGVCGHWDWTLGTGEGTHTDPGAGFPWDYVMAAANPAPAPQQNDEESDMPYILKSTKYPNGVLNDGDGNYVGLTPAEFAALTGTAGDGSTLAVKWSWSSDATIDELLRLSRIGKDTPEPTKTVA